MEVVMTETKLGALDVRSKPKDEYHGDKLCQYSSLKMARIGSERSMELFQAADGYSDLIFPSTPDLEVIYGPSASSESDHSPSSSAMDTGSNSLATMDIISPPAHAKDEELDVSFEEVQALFRDGTDNDAQPRTSMEDTGTSTSNKATVLVEKTKVKAGLASHRVSTSHVLTVPVPSASPGGSMEKSSAAKSSSIPMCEERLVRKDSVSLDDSASSMAAVASGSKRSAAPLKPKRTLTYRAVRDRPLAVRPKPHPQQMMVPNYPNQSATMGMPMAWAYPPQPPQMAPGTPPLPTPTHPGGQPTPMAASHYPAHPPSAAPPPPPVGYGPGAPWHYPGQQHGGGLQPGMSHSHPPHIAHAQGIQQQVGPTHGAPHMGHAPPPTSCCPPMSVSTPPPQMAAGGGGGQPGQGGQAQPSQVANVITMSGHSMGGPQMGGFPMHQGGGMVPVQGPVGAGPDHYPHMRYAHLGNDAMQKAHWAEMAKMHHASSMLALPHNGQHATSSTGYPMLHGSHSILNVMLPDLDSDLGGCDSPGPIGLSLNLSVEELRDLRW